MMNDMTLMKRFSDKSGAVGILPVLPVGEYSKGMDQFGAIFDGSDWGTFICGSPVGGPGITFAGHIIGGFIREHIEWAVVWKDDGGMKLPYLRHDDGTEVKFNNIHCYSKALKRYMSVQNG
jgi:hypothetical protein